MLYTIQIGIYREARIGQTCIYHDFFCSDGIDFYLISSQFLYMLDQTMPMLSFATRTDMFEAIKKADAKASDVDAFLATLLAEHDTVGARGRGLN